MTEQRTAKRFDLRLPLEVVRKSFQPVTSIGQTLNLSAGGVLFTASLDMEAGEPIEYLITFPSGSINGGQVQLRCLGKVLRSRRDETDPAGKGLVLVAATLERHEFLRNPK